LKQSEEKTDPASFLTKVVLVALPLLAARLHFQEACFLGLVLCLSFWGSLLFFYFTERLFPKPALAWAVLAWILALGEISWYAWGFKPFWVASLTLLLYDEIVTGKYLEREFFKTYFWEGLYAGTLVVFLGAFQEVSTYHWFLQAFSQPTGIFLLLALAVLIWQSQMPARES